MDVNAIGLDIEFIFTASWRNVKITRPSRLPNPNWSYEDVRLAAGLDRGGQIYYDRIPPDISYAKPYLIRFVRPVLRTRLAPWFQEKPIRGHGGDADIMSSLRF